MDTLTFKFIRDEPADADSFGSHSRLADTIAQVIAQGPDLKVVGLLGPWGAGKSTVIRLVQKALQSDAQIRTYCFSYDAWLVQNDPPRRAFLETLIHYLIAENLTSLKRWQPRLDQLNRQVEESETTTIPTLTKTGRAIGFSLLLWPLALPLLGHDWYAAAFKAGAPFSEIWPFWFGVCIALLPIALLLAFTLWRWIKHGYLFLRHFGKPDAYNAPQESESILALFINKEVQRQRNRVTRSPDPTTIEFQDIFREIMDAVTSDKRRFVFVIDNLDRLPEGDAVEMWSTIRSFFLGAREINNVRKAAALPTVILPIDEEAVRRMYSISHGDNDAAGLAKSFMDKTFDLSFHVTRPVLSDWNSYLTAQMKAVFGPAMPQEWPYITGRIYERALGNETAPTPRTVNTLINAIATLWMQWRNGGVSFASVAYYCIFRDGIDKNILGAVSHPAADVATFDPDWQRNIAALHYGAPPADAAQILIEQPVRNAITERNVKALSDLSGMPSFDRVLMRILDQFASDGIDALVVLSAAVMLQSLGDGDDVWRRVAWSRLLTAFRLTAQWRIFSQGQIDGIKALLAHCQPADLVPFASALNAKLTALDPGAIKDAKFAAFFVATWQAAFAALQSAKLPLPNVQVPGAADNFLEVAALCHEDAPLLKQLSTQAADTALVQELATILTDQARAATAENKYRALRALGRPQVWAQLVAASITVVRNQNANHPGMGAALRVLGQLRTSDKDARDQLQPLVNDGQLAGRLQEAYTQKRDAVAAQALALLVIGGNRGFAVPDNGNWAATFKQRPDFVRLIDEAFREYGGADTSQMLIDMSTSNSALLPIARAVFSGRVQKQSLGMLASAAVISNLPQYLACVDDALQSSFMEQMASQPAFWEQLAKQPFDGSVLTLLRALIKQKDGIAQTAEAALRERLANVNTAQWNTAVRGQSEPMPIAAELAAHAATPLEIGAQLYDALQAIIPDILASADTNLRARWFVAATYLGDSARQTLMRNLRDAILTTSVVTHLPALLATGDTALTDTGAFVEKADDCVRHIILPLLNDQTGVTWLVDHAALAGEWVRAAMPTTAAFLKDTLNTLANETSDQPRKDALRTLQAGWSPANDAGTGAANDEAAAS